MRLGMCKEQLIFSGFFRVKLEKLVKDALVDQVQVDRHDTLGAFRMFFSVVLVECHDVVVDYSDLWLF